MNAILDNAIDKLGHPVIEGRRHRLAFERTSQELCDLVQATLDATWVAIVRPVDGTWLEVDAVWPGTPPQRRLRGDVSQLTPFLDAPGPSTLTVSDEVPPLLAALAHAEDHSAAVVAPLRSGSAVALVIARTRRPVTAAVLRRLEAALRLGATAIGHALEADSAAMALEDEQSQSHEQEALVDIGRRLFHTVLDGGDTSAVLNQLSELVRKPVLLYTPDFVVTSWAAPTGVHCDGPPRIPLPLLTQRWFTQSVARLTRSQPCFTLDPNPSCGLNSRHLLAQLTVHGQVAGYLGIVAIGQDIRPSETGLAELAAIALSMQQLGQMLQLESEGRNQEDFLSELLRGGSPDRLIRRAPLFGVDLNRKHVLVRVEYRVDQDVDSSTMSGSARRAMLVEGLAAELVVGPPIAVGVPGADVLLLRIPRIEGPAEALKAVKDGVAAVVERLHGHVDVRRTLISEPCHDLSDFPVGHRDLFSLSELADARDWNKGTYLTSDLGILRLVLSNANADESMRFAAHILGALEEYDLVHRSALIETLRVYLDAGSNIRQTAHALDVHDNTIRYRLARIERLLGRRISALDDLIEFRVAMQIRHLYGTGDRVEGRSGAHLPSSPDPLATDGRAHDGRA